MNPPAPNEALDELVSILGEDDTRELVRSFLRDFPDQLRQLAIGDREQRRRVAHSLKSSSRHMGADALARKMAALETRLSHVEAEVSQEDLAATVSEFEKVAGGLRAFANRPHQP
jgi:HPt (histidine-containing phosphotransfer) domain-containing protein